MVFIYSAVLGLSCGVQDLGRVSVFFHGGAHPLVVARGLSHGDTDGGLVAPQHLISPTRDHTLIPCIAGQILIHWTTREVPGGPLS